MLFLNINNFAHAGKTNAHSHGSCKACPERKGTVAKKIFLTVSYFVAVLGIKNQFAIFDGCVCTPKQFCITKY